MFEFPIAFKLWTIINELNVPLFGISWVLTSLPSLCQVLWISCHNVLFDATNATWNVRSFVLLLFFILLRIRSKTSMFDFLAKSLFRQSSFGYLARVSIAINVVLNATRSSTFIRERVASFLLFLWKNSMKFDVRAIVFKSWRIIINVYHRYIHYNKLNPGLVIGFEL